MKHLVIGAGATLAEAAALGAAEDIRPPLMWDFAKKTWANFTPHPVLELYLASLGHTDLGEDPRDLFFGLERAGETNIERFMEYCWQNRHVDLPAVGETVPKGFISGLRISTPGAPEATIAPGEEFWENLLYHGIGSPIQFLMLQCFFENGKVRGLPLSRAIGSSLKPGDLVLNLNYDTVFELSLEQLGLPFSFAPNVPKGGDVLICKPHGSLNMVADNHKFMFGPPSWLGMPQAPGYRSYSGLMPPRLNKQYAQHPISAMIIQPVKDRLPNDLIFWGVGLTESDVDLVGLYRSWAKEKPTVTVINPSAAVAKKVEEILGLPAQHFHDLHAWQAAA